MQPFTRFSTYLCTFLLLIMLIPTQGQTLLDSLVSPNEEVEGWFGHSVAGIGGDVNADGVPDVIVGAFQEDPGSSPQNAGRAYIISGANGSIIHTLASPNEKRWGDFGVAVAGVGGDVNADGVADVIVGATGEDSAGIHQRAGRAYIFSGATGSVLHTLVSPNEETFGNFGISVASVGGDVNADGVIDVMVGAYRESPGSSPEEAGRAYMVSGADGSVIHTLSPPNEEGYDNFGRSVAGIGDDVNADGVPDVIVGRTGKAYIISGVNGSVIHTLSSPNEETYFSRFGESVADIGGDVNADGVADVLVGAFLEGPSSSPSSAGRAYIISGADGSVLDTLASPNQESDGYFGRSVAGVGGDVNADGVPDLIVSAFGEGPGSSASETGRAYIFSGATSSIIHTLSSPHKETMGIIGAPVAGLGGDVNADGVVDIIVGAYGQAPGKSPNEAGRAYIFDVSSTIGLEELSNENSITLFPSPTKGSFTLDLSTLRQATVRILSIDGRLIAQKENLPGGQHHFSLRQQAAGLYFVEVVAKEGMEVLKVVKE